MGAANITENPRPGEDLRPYVIAILDLLRGTQVPRSPAGIVVPSGAANDPDRPDLGSVDSPFENVYANAMLLGGLSLFNTDLSSSVGLHYVDQPGSSVFVWPWRGRPRALCFLYSGGGGGGGGSGGTTSSSPGGSGGGGGAAGAAGVDGGGVAGGLGGRPGTVNTPAGAGTKGGDRGRALGGHGGQPGLDSRVAFGASEVKTNGARALTPVSDILSVPGRRPPWPASSFLAGGGRGGRDGISRLFGGSGAAGTLVVGWLTDVTLGARVNITVGAGGRGGAGGNGDVNNGQAGEDGKNGSVLILSTAAA